MDQEAKIFKPRGTQNDFLTRSTARGEARRTRQRSRQPYWKSAGMSCEEAKLPTSLKNISPQKRRYGEGVEYRMNKYSRIEQAKNLAFQWKASNTDESDITVTQLLQSAPNSQSVGLKAKVLFKGDTETVYSKHAKKTSPNVTLLWLTLLDRSL